MLRSGHALFRHHRLLTARLAPRLGAAEAEDLASEAVARGLARPAPDGRQAPWIETIFRNLLADRGRRWARRARGAALAADREAGHVDTPEELLLAAERARAVADALPAIPAELREAVEARFFADQDYAELAAGRGMTATTARTRVHRGLARLRQALGALRALVPGWPQLSAAGAGPALAALVPTLVVALAAVPPPAARVVPARGDASAPRGHATRVHPLRATNDPPPPAGDPRATPALVRPNTARPLPPPAHQGAADGDDQTPVAVKRLDFEDDDVEGDLRRPDLQRVDGDPGAAKKDSLIEIPRSFEPAMTKMIEDL